MTFDLETASSKRRRFDFFAAGVEIQICSHSVTVYRGPVQRWREFQCHVVDALRLPSRQDYRRVMCVERKNRSITVELSKIITKVVDGRHRTAFFYKDICPWVKLTRGDEGLPYCLAGEARLLMHWLQKAHAYMKEACTYPPSIVALCQSVIDGLDECSTRFQYIEVCKV